jgi:peptidoglycan LD-endopeptidase CwlK
MGAPSPEPDRHRPCGVGKSFIAGALAQKAVREGFTSLYVRAPRLFRDLAVARADGSFGKLLDRIARIDVFLVDDWAMAPLADSDRRDFLEICDDRYQTRSTILTSQVPVAQWHDQIGDPTVADSILDRLVHNAHRIELQGASMRKTKNGKDDYNGNNVDLSSATHLPQRGEPMALRMFENDVIFLQRFLKSVGLYDGKIDGFFGPITNTAEETLDSMSAEIARELGTFDARTERNLVTLQPAAQRAARLFMGRVLAAGFNVRILSGTRSYAEQDLLFEQGRSLPGNIVTHARGGQSNHNFGLAWDIGLFGADGSYLAESPLYSEVPKVGLSPELEWGGSWKTFIDRPHYQLATTRKEMTQIRTDFEAGVALV